MKVNPEVNEIMSRHVVAAAINAATLAAIVKARQTGTKLVISDDEGHISEITPDEAEDEFNKSLKESITP